MASTTPFTINHILFISLLVVAWGMLQASAQEKPLSSLCNSESYPDGVYGLEVETVFQDLIARTQTIPGFICHSVNKRIKDDKIEVWGKATCSTSLPGAACYACLDNAKEQIKGICGNRKGAQATFGDCFMRYENYSFE